MTPPQAQSPRNLEANVGAVGQDSAAATAHEARSNLSTFAVDAMRAGASTGRAAQATDDAANAGGRAAEQVGEGISSGAAEAAAKVGKIGEAAGKMGMESIHVDEVIRNKIESQSHGFDKIKNKEVTDQDRKEAKEKLGKDLSDLIPEADRKAITDLQGAIIDGDLNKLSETLKGLSGDPEKLAKIVKAVNDGLNKNSFLGGVELSMDGKGNVLLYGDRGNTAVSIDPKTGESSLRAVERQPDGSVLLKPGEIINRTTGEVMKDLGNDATRSLTSPRFYNFGEIKPMWENTKPYFKGNMEQTPQLRPLNQLEQLPRGGGNSNLQKMLEKKD